MAFIGIETRIERVESMLCIGSSDVLILGIWGMAGIGKTTLAEAVYNRNISHFQTSHFFSNIREQSEIRGLDHIRDVLVSKTSANFDRKIQRSRFTSFGKSRRSSSSRKALIVLDDVNSSMQLQELLVEGRHLFGPGSKIIVTSRDRQVLKNGVDQIYEAEGLNHNESLQLFSICAFGQDQPFEEFMHQSRMLMYYAKGNPLALRVLGCFLKGKRKGEWEIASNELEKTSDLGMKNVLRLSYDGLEVEDKEIFLDIACFFKGEDAYFVERILNGCGFSVNIGITNLVDQSLITISNNKVWMHQLLQEMGLEIVQQESMEEPGQRSRLWHHQDVHHVLTNNTGTRAVEGISLDLSTTRELHLTSEAFKKMYNLRLLKFHDPDFEYFSKVHFPDEGLTFHSNKLRYFHWYRYPSKSLPSNFFPENLVELNLPLSNLKHLWEGDPHLVNLKRIDLSHSEYLIRIPDLSKAQNLESINVKGCKNLVDIPSSIQHLNRLEFLNLQECKKLISYPRMIASKVLKSIDLYGCSNVQKFPEIAGDVEEIHLSFTAIEEVPSSIELLTKLGSLNLNYCTKLTSLTSSICKLNSLCKLSLVGCSKLEKFPEIVLTMEGLKYLSLADCKNLTSLPSSIGNLKHLIDLNLKGTMITELPSSIEHLTDLEDLILERCKKLLKLPESIGGLKSLKVLSLEGCSKLEQLPQNLQNLESLVELNISSSGIKCLPSFIIHLKNLELLSYRVTGSAALWKIPTALDSLSSLRVLALTGNNFERIPESIEKLSWLEHLDVGYCKKLQSLPKLPQSLIFLYAPECTSLETLLSSEHFLKLNYEPDGRNLKDFSFTNCFKIEHSSFLEDIVERIQLNASASDQLYTDDESSVKIHFPGSEIPIWFCNTSMGSSVRIQLHSSYNQLRGVALCAVLEFEECSSISYMAIRCKCNFKSVDCGRSSDLNFNMSYSVDRGYYPPPFKSSHLFVWDDSCSEAKAIGGEDWFSKYSEVSFEFYPLDFKGNLLQGCKVRKCGIRLLFDDTRPSTAFIYDHRDKRLKYDEGISLADNSKIDRMEQTIQKGPETRHEKAQEVFGKESKYMTRRVNI
ncbi:disease resistance protein RPV1-like [Euphorbia lathyris]|uniref:disease resistance protein RPV1-like n=1 Tax=Euphorbia lathyris TaxID=212925 RepID=UPI0033138E77